MIWLMRGKSRLGRLSRMIYTRIGHPGNCPNRCIVVFLTFYITLLLWTDYQFDNGFLKLNVPRLILAGMAVIVQRLYYMLFFIVITLLSNVNVYKGFALITMLILILKTYLPSLVSNSIARDFYLILSVANSPLLRLIVGLLLCWHPPSLPLAPWVRFPLPVPCSRFAPPAEFSRAPAPFSQLAVFRLHVCNPNYL